jgi:DeoR family fructose operon transcriptional repressor
MKVKKELSKELRGRYIVKYLDKNESISIHEITSYCNISPVTVRRDLAELEGKGLLIRTHGGAIKPGNQVNLFDFDYKTLKNREEKIEICRRASFFINENETIYLDCGSTVFYMARFLKKMNNVRIITNSLPVVSELIQYPKIRIYLIGGELDNSRKALYGPMTENLLERYKADKAFIGAGGVSLKKGLSSIDEKEASITRKMAESATQVFLLCDSTKLEKDTYFNYSSLSKVTCLITDRNADTDIIKLYKKNNINILTC